VVACPGCTSQEGGGSFEREEPQRSTNVAGDLHVVVIRRGV
jgi:hypothetical protein